jgi:cytosine/adenosine deaminase-related metal-dependent hydrolase
MFSPRAFTCVNATLPGTAATSVRVSKGHIVAVGEPPRAHDAVVDCGGDWLLPGLINAHDHLELNNFARLKWRECYANAREWIADFQPRFKTDLALIKPMSVPLADRLLISGLKNLLSGVTTVAHHNPLHARLRRSDFPVRVVQRYGWAHSLLIDGEDRVLASCRRTPVDQPWIIHLAEGVDDEAAGELSRLDRLGCLRANTLIVHGVGLTAGDRALLLTKGAGLIWCPSSNLFMLGHTAEVRELTSQGRVALGSDSRLSGERDLLEELRVACEATAMDGAALLPLVTTYAARLLRVSAVGTLRPGALADLLVLPASRKLFELNPSTSGGPHAQYATAAEPSPPARGMCANVSRSAVRLVMRAGRALYADPQYAPAFDAGGTRAACIQVDGHGKLLERSLVSRLRLCSIQEPGVAL